LLAIGAHPDDLEIGAFGSLAKWASRFRLHLVLATAGERGLASQGPSCSRLHESEAAAAVIGAEIDCLGLPDGAVRDEIDTVQRVEQLVCRLKPRRVLVNCALDSHQDHRRLARAVVSATRIVPEVLLYETPSTATGFNPSLFVDVTDNMEAKRKCIELHLSPAHRPYTTEAYTYGVAAAHAMRLGRQGRYLEAFQVQRMLEP
jgi:LmbE family N-acetylglucosaminyl deacetylase